MIRKTIAFSALAISLCQPVIAQEAAKAEAAAEQEQDSFYLPVTGDDLVQLIQDCESPKCMSYVSGALNGISVYLHIANQPQSFCADETVGSNEIRDAIVDVVASSPRLGQYPAPVAILTAFSRKWPCPDDPSAVAGQIDAADEPQNLITFTDLPAVDIDQLLDFVSRNTWSLDLGDPEAPLEKTLHVFDDPSCEFCNTLTDELPSLIDAGWRVLIYPIASPSGEARGYAAVQYALRDHASDAAMRLYQNGDGEKTFESAASIAQESGVTLSDIMNALAASNPYEAIDFNTRAHVDLGGTAEPTWILGDRIASGITDADEIIRLQQTMPAQEEPVELRPGLKGE